MPQYIAPPDPLMKQENDTPQLRMQNAAAPSIA